MAENLKYSVGVKNEGMRIYEISQGQSELILTVEYECEAVLVEMSRNGEMLVVLDESNR